MESGLVSFKSGQAGAFLHRHSRPCLRKELFLTLEARLNSESTRMTELHCLAVNELLAGFRMRIGSAGEGELPPEAIDRASFQRPEPLRQREGQRISEQARATVDRDQWVPNCPDRSCPVERRLSVPVGKVHNDNPRNNNRRSCRWRSCSRWMVSRCTSLSD
jgi:hypothetical protein